ncbi:MAG: hypothetical protein K8E66_10470, partial [Phycisphaerales bacterium]|nr:hypothetical protein [Phycisphaerales bacterium]
MKRITIPALAAAALTLPGCLIIDGSSGSSYDGYGRVTRTELDHIVASNTQNRIGEPQAVVLARYPAENVSLM